MTESQHIIDRADNEQTQLVDVDLTETHFFGVSGQSNIYGLSVLPKSDITDQVKVLVSSLKRKIHCFEYQSQPVLAPREKEVNFTYIPSNAEIISMDSFNRSKSGLDTVVGITFVKIDDKAKNQYYFNIYSDWETTVLDSKFNLDSLAQRCHSIEISAVPYFLTHCRIPTELEHEIVWLLTTGTNQVKLFKEDRIHQAYAEQHISHHFPELDNLPSIALSLEMKYLHDNPSHRLTAIGFEDGSLHVYLTKTKHQIKTSAVLKSWKGVHDGPISCLLLFNTSNMVADDQEVKDGVINSGEANLVVGCTLQSSIVYANILDTGLTRPTSLPESDKFDCVQCVCVADVNMDGENEILIGTYGQEMLCYKQNPDSTYYNLIWRRSFAYPLMRISEQDMTGDGVREIVVLTTRGLHILQHNLEGVLKLLLKRLQALQA